MRVPISLRNKYAITKKIAKNEYGLILLFGGKNIADMLCVILSYKIKILNSFVKISNIFLITEYFFSYEHT